MYRATRSACGLAAATAFVVAAAPQPASATVPPEEGSGGAVESIEAPVDNRTSDELQAIVATAFGASIAMALRRRPPSSGSSSITAVQYHAGPIVEVNGPDLPTGPFPPDTDIVAF